MQRPATSDGDRRTLLRRVICLGAAMLFWVGVLGARLYEIQVALTDDYRAQAAQQQKGFIEIAPRRGEILDSGLSPLAVSVPVDSLFAHPDQVEDAARSAQALAPLLQLPAEQLEARLASGKSFVYLARRIPPQTAEEVLKLGLEGIYSHPETRRFYPNRELASHILGFVGTDGAGLSGLEYYYQDELKGQKARVGIRVDARRRSYFQEQVTERTRGNTLVLNVDKGLQFIAQQVLRETIQSHTARSGTAVLMDPKTGAVLAMASYPEFDPNRYQDYDPERYRNRAIRIIYEPGSTFKIFSLAAVLNQQLVSLDEDINCKVGSVRLASKVYKEAGYHDYGILKFNQVVAKSSNVGTIRLVLRLGEEGLSNYMRRLGFGEKTGIDLPGEEAGLLRPTNQWSRLSIGALSIGQEIGVTALQIVAAVSAVANGGYRVRPQMVRQILDPRGETLWQTQPQHRRVLSSRTAQLMREALTEVVESGTGHSAALNGYSSAGKTGTAQMIVDGVYSKTLHVPSYVGFAPVDDPALAAVVVIHEPRGEYYAAKVAAPAFRQIMERALMHLEVPRDLPLRPRKKRQASALATSAELHNPPGISESGQRQQAEEDVEGVRGEGSGQDGRHVVVLERSSDQQVPDFSGMSLRQVLDWSNRMGIHLQAEGSGMAVRQKPVPGSGVYDGMALKVHFSRQAQGRKSDVKRSSAPAVAEPGGGRH